MRLHLDKKQILVDIDMGIHKYAQENRNGQHHNIIIFHSYCSWIRMMRGPGTTPVSTQPMGPKPTLTKRGALQALEKEHIVSFHLCSDATPPMVSPSPLQAENVAFFCGRGGTPSWRHLGFFQPKRIGARSPTQSWLEPSCVSGHAAWNQFWSVAGNDKGQEPA